MKKMEKFKIKVRKPNFFLFFFLYFFVYIYVKIRCNLQYNKKEVRLLRKQKNFLILFNHGSKLDFAFAYLPLRKRINTMVAYYYFCNYKTGQLIHLLGGFPKCLFNPDISAIKNSLKIIKNNGSLGIAPEGRLSPHGTLESFNPAIVKLIRKLNVDVYMAHIKGGYLTFPKWSKHIKKGKVEVTYELLFQKDRILDMSEEAITQDLHQALSYDDFAWEEKENIAYHGRKFSEGLEYILYICPVCKKMYTLKTKDNRLVCSHCHEEIILNEYYQFISQYDIPKNIRDWYNWQKEYERNIPDDFFLKSRVTLKLPSEEGKGFCFAGEGICLLNKDGLRYQGTINNEEKDILFRIENLPAILFGVNEDFEIYYSNTLYYFVPENIKECVRYSIIAEIFYKKFLEKGQ